VAEAFLSTLRVPFFRASFQVRGVVNRCLVPGNDCPWSSTCAFLSIFVSILKILAKICACSLPSIVSPPRRTCSKPLTRSCENDRLSKVLLPNSKAPRQRHHTLPRALSSLSEAFFFVNQHLGLLMNMRQEHSRFMRMTFSEQTFPLSVSSPRPPWARSDPKRGPTSP